MDQAPSSFVIVSAILKDIKSHNCYFMDYRNSPERLALLPKVAQLLDIIASYGSGLAQANVRPEGTNSQLEKAKALGEVWVLKALLFLMLGKNYP